MKRAPSRLLIVLASLLIGAAGCAYPISPELRERARPDLTYPVVAPDPMAYAGETIIWGGVVVLGRSRPNQTTLTVLETPLDFWGVPKGEASGRGRFIAQVPRYLNEEAVGGKKKITLAGTIIGRKTLPLAEPQVGYPVVQVKEFHLFEDRFYYPYDRSNDYNRRYRHHYDEPSHFHGIH